MDPATVLLDSRTGLHARWYFLLRVLDETNRSARYGEPFGVLLVEAQAADGSPRVAARTVSRLSEIVRDTDIAGVLGDARAGVVLPHQDADAADLAARRIMRELQRKSRRTRVDWRLLRYPRDGADIATLVTAGWPERVGAERQSA